MLHEGKEQFPMSKTWNDPKVRQITLPDPNDHDPHPRILVNGRGIHAGETFTALFPDG